MTGGSLPPVLQSPHLLPTRRSWDWEDELSLGSLLQFGLEGSLTQVPQESWTAGPATRGCGAASQPLLPSAHFYPRGQWSPQVARPAALRQRLPLPVSTHPPKLHFPSLHNWLVEEALPRRVHPICSDGLGGQQGRDQDFTDEETNKLSKNKGLAGGPGTRPLGLAGSTLWLHRSHKRPAVVPSRIAAHRPPGAHSTMITLCPLRG